MGCTTQSRESKDIDHIYSYSFIHLIELITINQIQYMNN